MLVISTNTTEHCPMKADRSAQALQSAPGGTVLPRGTLNLPRQLRNRRQLHPFQEVPPTDPWVVNGSMLAHRLPDSRPAVGKRKMWSQAWLVAAGALAGCCQPSCCAKNSPASLHCRPPRAHKTALLQPAPASFSHTSSSCCASPCLPARDIRGRCL